MSEVGPRPESWYGDPHGFAERSWVVRRRRARYARVIRKLVPDVTLWGWADVDGARVLREAPVSVPTPDPGPRERVRRRVRLAETHPELVRRRIHPPFTAE